MGSEKIESELEAELLAHHGAAFGWALACCEHDRSEAEDVLHISYEKILSGTARFGERSTFRSWLFGVIRLTALERRRSRLTRLRLLRRWFEGDRAIQPTSQRPDFELTERNRQLVTALQRLSGRQRQVLHLVFYDGFTVEEAAGVMKISVGTARTHYKRGKERLRQQLASLETP